MGIGVVITVHTTQSRELELRESLLTEARLASVGVDSMQVSTLTASASDLSNPEYHTLKKQIKKIQTSYDHFKFVYLFSMNADETIVFLVDSEQPGTAGYSPPGQIYTEASPLTKEVFLTGRESTVGPVTDRWGTFVSGLIPISHPESGEIIAVFGVDIQSDDWNQTVMASAVVPAVMTALIALLLIFLIILSKQSEREAERLAASEARLRKSEEILKEAQKNARLGLFEYEPLSGEIKCSQEAFGILGAEPARDAVLSSVFIEFIHPDDRELFNQIKTRSVNECSPFEVTLRLVMKDGRRKWVNVIGRTERESEGNVRMHGTIQDVSELHEAEEKIRKDEKRLRLLIRNSSDIIIVMNKDRIFRYASESLHRVTGYQPEEIVNQPFTPQMIYPDDYPAFSRFLDELIKKPGKPQRVLYRHRHKTDGYVYLETIGTNMLDDPVINGIILNSRDFAEIKKAEERLLATLGEIQERNRELEAIRAEMIQVNDNLEERVHERTRDLEESKEQIEQLLVQKDQFIYQLAHDLRTPLTPIVAMLPLLIIGISDPDSKSLLEIFNKSIQYLQKMVEDIIVYSQLNRQYSVTDYAEYFLKDLITDAVDTNAYPAEQKEITFIRDIPEDIIIRLSKSHSRQLFRNLINNAVKYNVFRGTITVSALKEKDGVTITISDTGVGIDENLMEKIWDEFTTGDSARRDPEAKGLGLPIVRRIIILHGGTIQCSSEGTGTGATFTLYLPDYYYPQITVSDNDT